MYDMYGTMDSARRPRKSATDDTHLRRGVWQQQKVSQSGVSTDSCERSGIVVAMDKTRVEHMVGEYALWRIQSAGDDGMYTAVTTAALYLATAGFLAEADSLLSRLWSYPWPHTRTHEHANRGLEVLWHVAGHRPPNAPFAPEPIDRIELAYRTSTAGDRWGGAIPTRSWQDLGGLDLLRRSMRLAYPRTDQGSPPPPEDELEALRGLVQYIDTFVEPNGWTFALATCLAAELAARNGRLEQATRYAIRWAERYSEFWPNYGFGDMARNRHVAPLLLRGILAEPLGLTAAASRRYLDRLLVAVDTRMARGRTLVFGEWPWERLLAAISEQARDEERVSDTQEEDRHGLSARTGATAEVVATAEAGLHIQLPPDYVAFVRASNGFSPTETAPLWLLPIEEIDYLRHVADPELFAIYKDYAGDDMPELIERCLLVSDKEAEEMTLLIPPLTAGGHWQTWFFASWVPGEVRYPSFRHYMEQELQGLLSRS